DDLDQRRLARSIVPDEVHDLAGADVQVDVCQGVDGAGSRGDARQRLHGGCGCRLDGHRCHQEIPAALQAAAYVAVHMFLAEYSPVSTMFFFTLAFLTATGSKMNDFTPSKSVVLPTSLPVARASA